MQVRELYGIIRKQKRLIFRITGIALFVSVIAGILVPKHYKAETVFVLRNPLYADRANLFHEAARPDYFASEADITRLIAMAASDSLQQEIISRFGLVKAYDIDTADLEDRSRFRRKIRRSLELYLAENKDIVLLYYDKDPERAAAVANYYVPMLERTFRDFYGRMRQSMFDALQQKIREQDTAISLLTDSLSQLRERYGIFDIISPVRHNLMLGKLQPGGKPGFAKGMELVQNVEALKDEMVSDRARNQTVTSQLSASLESSAFPLIQITRAAQVPYRYEGPGLLLLVLFSGCIAFFFSVLYVLAAAKSGRI